MSDITDFPIAQRDTLEKAFTERGLADHVRVGIDPVVMEATVAMTPYAAAVLLGLTDEQENDDE